ncbi:MAG: sigma-E factor negative regulatory protein RseA [Halieaceae bacterium]|jgi:sigma-E factor negative regulatory protein RseA
MNKYASMGAAVVKEETLSAMVDGEAQDLELRRLLRDVDGQPELRDRWYRHHLVRSAMLGDVVVHAPGFAESVRAAIDAEPALEQEAGANWRRAVGSFAVAASVAVVVVLGGQQLALTAGSGSADTIARITPMPVGVVNTVGAVPVRASYGTRALPTLQPADRTAYRELARQRLKRYSQEHAEHASLNTPQGMLPFARVPSIER